MPDRAVSAKQANVKAAPKPGGGGTRFKYLGELASELKKVVWLTRAETAYLTTLVVIVSVVVGIVLGLLDFGFSSIIDKVWLGR